MFPLNVPVTVLMNVPASSGLFDPVTAPLSMVNRWPELRRVEPSICTVPRTSKLARCSHSPMGDSEGVLIRRIPAPSLSRKAPVSVTV